MPQSDSFGPPIYGDWLHIVAPLKPGQLTPDVLTVHPPGTPASEMGMARFCEGGYRAAVGPVEHWIAAAPNPPFGEWVEGCRPVNLSEELAALKKAHLELAAMVHARLDRLEAADRANRFGYNGGL